MISIIGSLCCVSHYNSNSRWWIWKYQSENSEFYVTRQLSRLDLEYVHPCLSDLYIHMHPHHCLNYQYGILIIIIIVTILLLMITISSRHHCSFDPYSHRPYLVEDSKGQVWRELFLWETWLICELPTFFNSILNFVIWASGSLCTFSPSRPL